MKTLKWALAATALLAGSATPAVAQAVYVTPAVGVFIPASDLKGVQSGADQARLEREGTLGLGLNVDIGWLRGSLAYASGASISEEGQSGDIGDGSVLAVAVDLVVRPLPRLVVQPYVLGGVGFKGQNFSFDEDRVDDLALHAGVGADAMFGRFGVMAEITDYITRNQDDSFGQHDAFAMIGLRVRLGGR